MLSEGEEELLEVHKDEIFAKCIFDLKMIFDREKTMEFLINTYTEVEGEAPAEDVKLKRWFFNNFESTPEGWVQKPRWLH